MKRKIFTFAILIVALLSSCKKDDPVQDVVTFEELPLGSSGFWNGSDLSGGFSSGNIRFPNHFNTQYNSWTGFVYSSVTDTVTKDFTNQYSCVAKGGIDGSEKYAVYYYPGVPDTIFFTLPEKVTEIGLCNSVYTYHTIKNGNQFSKKFGGPTGNDQDWFKLTISALDENGIVTGWGEIFLADYRSANNAEDYILNNWGTVDLSAFGLVSALKFELSSSDTGDFGMNTPAYVCIDNIKGLIASELK